jgi:transcriptional regulator with XRE-family HTH domain
MIFIVYSCGMPKRDTEDKWEPLDSLGETGTVVARNIKRVRKARNLAYTDLSTRLHGLGREIPTWGLRKIESGGRRVDADDLVALGLALNVSPIALLLPTEAARLVDKGNRYPAERLWNWAKGTDSLSGDPLEFMRDSNPLNASEIESWMQTRLNESVGPALWSLKSRQKERSDRQEKIAGEVSSGDH